MVECGLHAAGIATLQCDKRDWTRLRACSTSASAPRIPAIRLRAAGSAVTAVTCDAASGRQGRLRPKWRFAMRV